MTIDEAKQKVAEKYFCTDWTHFKSVYKGKGVLEKQMERVALFYAQSKWEQACEAQQNKIIDAILSSENPLAKDITVMEFAKEWKSKHAPKPEFNP